MPLTSQDDDVAVRAKQDGSPSPPPILPAMTSCAQHAWRSFRQCLPQRRRQPCLRGPQGLRFRSRNRSARRHEGIHKRPRRVCCQYRPMHPPVTGFSSPTAPDLHSSKQLAVSAAACPALPLHGVIRSRLSAALMTIPGAKRSWSRCKAPAISPWLKASRRPLRSIGRHASRQAPYWLR